VSPLCLAGLVLPPQLKELAGITAVHRHGGMATTPESYPGRLIEPNDMELTAS
jgi:hypothetical protein